MIGLFILLCSNLSTPFPKKFVKTKSI